MAISDLDVLYSGQLPGGSGAIADLYTCPAGRVAIVWLVLANTDRGSPYEAHVFIKPSGGSDRRVTGNGYQVAAMGHDTLPDGARGYNLGAGDKLRAYATATDGTTAAGAVIDVTVFGGTSVP